MRLDHFLERNGIAVATVSQFDGYLVEVAVPLEWEAVDTSSSATPVCIWRDKPGIEPVCANAVLTLVQADAALDPAEVFAMLCEWQVQMLPGIHEVNRESALTDTDTGAGVRGTLALLINTDVGVLESVVMSRIIPTCGHTLIAQLTFTALAESRVGRGRIGLGVVTASMSARSPAAVPESATAEGH